MQPGGGRSQIKDSSGLAALVLVVLIPISEVLHGLIHSDEGVSDVLHYVLLLVMRERAPPRALPTNLSRLLICQALAVSSMSFTRNGDHSSRHVAVVIYLSSLSVYSSGGAGHGPSGVGAITHRASENGTPSHH